MRGWAIGFLFAGFLFSSVQAETINQMRQERDELLARNQQLRQDLAGMRDKLAQVDECKQRLMKYEKMISELKEDIEKAEKQNANLSEQLERSKSKAQKHDVLDAKARTVNGFACAEIPERQIEVHRELTAWLESLHGAQGDDTLYHERLAAVQKDVWLQLRKSRHLNRWVGTLREIEVKNEQVRLVIVCDCLGSTITLANNVDLLDPYTDAAIVRSLTEIAPHDLVCFSGAIAQYLIPDIYGAERPIDAETGQLAPFAGVGERHPVSGEWIAPPRLEQADMHVEFLFTSVRPLKQKTKTPSESIR